MTEPTVAQEDAEPTRSSWVYVTNTTPQQAVRVDAPFGLIMPPTLELHRPQVGPVTFYHAAGYRLDVDPLRAIELYASAREWIAQGSQV